MHLAPYRAVLGLPGVRPLLVLATLARIPVLAGSMVLTLHVVLEMRLGFGPAGAVFAACVLGGAVGQPFMGRMTDRYGLRPVVLVGVVAPGLFWSTAGLMSYPVLLVAGFLSTTLAFPVMTLSRQALAALVPVEHRRPAYSLDSILVEVSYMAGPSLGAGVVTQVSTQAALWAVGVGVVLTGAGFLLLDPPLHDDGHSAGRAGPRTPLNAWMRPDVSAVLLAVAGAALVLGASEVALVAALEHAGEVTWTSLVLMLWGAFSMAGGLVYGGLRRPPGPVVLMLLLGLGTVLLASAEGWALLCIALVPAGLLCAPTLAAAADALSRRVPATVRGEAMGYYGSALNSGLAVGTWFAGLVIDLAGPSVAFVAAGGAGMLIAGVALVLERRRGQPALGAADAVATTGH